MHAILSYVLCKEEEVLVCICIYEIFITSSILFFLKLLWSAMKCRIDEVFYMRWEKAPECSCCQVLIFWANNTSDDNYVIWL